MSQSTSGESNLPTDLNLPSYKQEAVRHILLGDRPALIEAINRMELLGYCVGRRPALRAYASPGLTPYPPADMVSTSA